MSVKEKRSVTFEEPESNLRLSQPNLGSSQPSLGFSQPSLGLSQPNLGFSELNISSISLKTIYKTDSRSRSIGRAKSWSRFRARRTKSHDVLPNPDSNYSSQIGLKSDVGSAHLVRTGSRSSVRSLVRLFETRSMSEGRKSQIIFLDERRLDIIIQPKLYASELLDLVASHVRLKEKQYFGLGFMDETNHFNWLQGEKRVLDHEFPKKTGLLILYFAIKLYVETIGLLRDVQTVELFYLNARQLLFTGHLQCDAETVFELAANVLQATNGDFVSDEKTKEELKKLPVIPTYTLKERPSLAYCEERVISYYEKICGISRGLAIVNYMAIVERLETYGIHYYDVKDKKDIPWWLGISPRGIAVFDKADKKTPRKLFNWKSLENLYYKDKKFSIEVHSPRRAIGANNVDIHTWFASTQQLIKCIWSMAVVQHQFYLDRKQSLGHQPVARSMSDIAVDLCMSSTSLPGSLGSDLSHSPSSQSLLSLSNSRYDLTVEQSDSLKAERDMYLALKARREALQESLRKKTEELKLICVQEGELTGRLPNELPLSPGERPPAFRRRVGTSFSLSVKNLQDTDQLSSELCKLELEVDLQDKITAAAYRLATDKTVTKYVRKQRKQSYTRAQGKLKDMKKKLDDLRRTTGKYKSSEQKSGRSQDGTYHVVQQCPNRDHDLHTSRIIIVHDRSPSRQDDSCGNSINSGDFSVVAGSKGASSGYCSPSNSSISGRSHQLINDDMSSFCGSISLSTVKSFRDDVSTSDVQSFHTGDPVTSNAFTFSEDDDQNLTLTRAGRRKHFIISRGPQSNRVQEMDYGLEMSKAFVSARFESPTVSHLATSESDLDLDSTLDDSVMGNCSIYGGDDDLREEEEKVCTRVERRRQTFIASRRLMKNLDSDIKHTGFERGWETFQHILMGEDFVHNDVSDGQTKNSLHLEDANRKVVGSKMASNGNEAELQRKIQELISGEDVATPFVRSRSFDYARDMRINGAKNVNVNKSKDDIKLTKARLKVKDSTTSLKNPFVFLTKRHNKAKQMKNGSSEAQTSVSTKASVPPDVGTIRSSSAQSCLSRKQVDEAKRNSHSGRDSHKLDPQASSSDIKSPSSLAPKSTTHQINTSRDSHKSDQPPSSSDIKSPSSLAPKSTTSKDVHKPDQPSGSDIKSPSSLAPKSTTSKDFHKPDQPSGSDIKSPSSLISKSSTHQINTSKDSHKLDQSSSSSDIKSPSSLAPKSYTHHTSSHGHYPRSVSESTAGAPKRSVPIDNRHTGKAATTKDSSSHQHTSGSASSSKDLSAKCCCDHGSQQSSKRRSSWHSNSRSYNLPTKSTETTV